MPSVLASVSASDCSGSTNSVTTLTEIGLLSFSTSRSMRVPAVSTVTLVRMTFDVMSVDWFVGLTVTSTSTFDPGNT